jgi:TetR/AcrR family transcriptional regulator
VKRTAILDAAKEEFIDHGYEAASINRIIRTSGTSKGTFYYHFSSKQELYAELLQDIQQEKLKFSSTHVSSGPQGSDLISLITRQLSVTLAFAHACPLSVRFLIAARRETHPEIRPLISDTIEQAAREFYTPVITSSIAAGELRDDVPSSVVIDYVVHFIVGLYDLLQAGQQPADSVPEAEIMERGRMMLSLFARGIGPS